MLCLIMYIDVKIEELKKKTLLNSQHRQPRPRSGALIVKCRDKAVCELARCNHLPSSQPVHPGWIFIYSELIDYLCIFITLSRISQLKNAALLRLIWLRTFPRKNVPSCILLRSRDEKFVLAKMCIARQNFYQPIQVNDRVGDEEKTDETDFPCLKH